MAKNETAIAQVTPSNVKSIENARYASFEPISKEDKIKLYNAFNSPDEKIGSVINQSIDVVDVVLAHVELVNERTGEVEDAVRTILIDKEGRSFDATSSGIYNSVLTIQSVFGTLHFSTDEPLTVVVKQIKTKRGSTLTLSII